MGATLSVCQFPLDQWGRMANNPQWCQPVSGWAASFRSWVARPVESRIITRTPFFDLRGGDR
ncbi:MAG: hypothetical protein J6386_02990 [Candidatus Synoicihabitans palmerolidicus]|nr:hypothetical protein [Candidatus Synoicihabitans palmerolidicus]